MTYAVELRRVADRWFDVVLAAVLLAATEAEIVNDLRGDRGHDHWPVPANVVLVAGMAVAVGWRRRAPVLSGCVVVGCAAALITGGIADISNTTTTQFALFVPAYAAAAYRARKAATVALAAYVAVFATALAVNGAGSSSWAFVIAANVGSWLVGVAIRERRGLIADLVRTRAQLAAEREEVERLAVIEQRTRIANELQALVAANVSDMVVQARAAAALLAGGSDDVGPALTGIEETGRRGLTEMRRILGALRRPDERAELAPPAGLGRRPAVLEPSTPGSI